ncbi:hypothetical protein ACOMHN_065782 [Nucella lapillus]
MKYLKEWDIVYENNCDTFRPGDVVQGKLVVDVEHTITLSKIKVKFKGKAEVTVFIGDYDTQRVNYFNREKVMFNCPDNTGSTDLVPGHYEYPFQFTLPAELPYTFSCEGDESGVIIYMVQATIYRPGKYTYVYDKPFKVLGVLDLNCFQDSRSEVENNKTKIMSCLFCNMGSISVECKLPKRGYIPGEEVHVDALLNNDSKHRMKKSAVYLGQRITMMVYGSKSEKIKKFCKCCRGPIPPGGKDEWHGSALIIPKDLPPTSKKRCELIDIEYFVQVVVTPVGLGRKLRVPLDIVIGTVPLDPPKSNPNPHKVNKDLSLFDNGTCV